MIIKSYSENGEDAWVYNYTNPPMTGVFVDVGCKYPTVQNNTYLFETLGWKGLCITKNANKENFEKYRKSSIFVDAELTRTPKSKTEPTTLNKIFKDQNIETIDLLSLNADGRELEVLHGLELIVHNPRIIVLAYKLNDGFKALEYLIRKGYKIQTLTESNFILTK